MNAENLYNILPSAALLCVDTCFKTCISSLICLCFTLCAPCCSLCVYTPIRLNWRSFFLFLYDDDMAMNKLPIVISHAYRSFVFSPLYHWLHPYPPPPQKKTFLSLFFILYFDTNFDYVYCPSYSELVTAF
ncbi:unnamed protein product [Arctogadus glacialis]